jgi:MFS family permease
MTQVLLCGAAIVTLSMGIRHGFGLWLQPITMERGWTREHFAFALALQNITWGVAGLFAGMVSDRLGAYRVLVAGSVFYAAGLALMPLAASPWAFAASAGVMIGLAQAGTTYAIVYGVIGRNIDADKRSWAMGAAAAAGSFGQFLMVPVENTLINGSRMFGLAVAGVGWQGALFVLAALALLIVPLASGLRERWLESGQSRPQQSIGGALREAFAYPSFRLLMAGYFVCGFQVVFIGVHLPSYLRDKGLTPDVATTALALIGLFNVIGTYAAGVLGQRWPKRFILSSIYILRAVAIVVFLWLPLTPWSVYIFSSVMGVLWLSTVPATNAVVAQIFGVHYLSMLAGFVFLAHQVGSFMGAWLGGKLYDTTGSYDVVWWIAVALGLFAALINLPVRESAIARHPVPAAAAA